MSEEIEDKIKWLLTEIDVHIKRFSDRRENNKWKAFTLHMATTFLGAIITVLLGLNFSKLGFDKGQNIDEILRMVALILGALVTTISAFNTFFGHKYLWINYTKTRNKLYKLTTDIDYYLIDNKNVELGIIDKFKIELDKILEKANQDWVKLREND